MAQYFLATRMKISEDAWKAVIVNYPENKVTKPRAQIRLGLLLTRPERYEDAKSIFQELVNTGQSEFIVNGYAGLMTLESLNGDARISQDIWELHIRDHIRDLDTEMIDYVVRALRSNQISLKIDNEEYIDRLLNLSGEEERTLN